VGGHAEKPEQAPVSKGGETSTRSAPTKSRPRGRGSDVGLQASWGRQAPASPFLVHDRIERVDMSGKGSFDRIGVVRLKKLTKSTRSQPIVGVATLGLSGSNPLLRSTMAWSDFSCPWAEPVRSFAPEGRVVVSGTAY